MQDQNYILKDARLGSKDGKRKSLRQEWSHQPGSLQRAGRAGGRRSATRRREGTSGDTPGTALAVSTNVCCAACLPPFPLRCWVQKPLGETVQGRCAHRGRGGERGAAQPGWGRPGEAFPR